MKQQETLKISRPVKALPLTPPLQKKSEALSLLKEWTEGIGQGTISLPLQAKERVATLTLAFTPKTGAW